MTALEEKAALSGARRESSSGGVVGEGILADDAGIWLFGHVFEGKAPSRVYLERIAF